MTAAPVIEPTDTYLVTATIKMNAAPPASKGIGTKAAAAPALVATPLPPLNLSHTGKLWPTTAAMAESTAVTGPAASRCIPRATGAYPFAKSSRKASTPNTGPHVRSTLVAPMLPLPSFLTSLPAANPSSRPNGIEPRRYAPTTHPNESSVSSMGTRLARHRPPIQVQRPEGCKHTGVGT